MFDAIDPMPDVALIHAGELVARMPVYVGHRLHTEAMPAQ